MTATFLIRTEFGYVPLEQATDEQKAALGVKILQNMGRVISGE